MINPAALQGRWMELPDRAVLRISGPDRVRFLNGQVSNDVSGPLHERTAPACLCSIKGKVEALVWIAAEGDTLLLDGELSQREFLRERLERYLIADDCEIADETGARRLLHHFRPGAGGPSSRRFSVPGFDLWIDGGPPPGFDEAARVGPAEIERLGVLSLLPESGREITGDEFPAELGLDEWAVDFRKGCYLGQEVVSRIKSVGRVKRRLRRVVLETPAEQGDPLQNELGERGFATRGTISDRKNSHLAMGLFRGEGNSAQIPEKEPVATRAEG